MGAFSRHMGWSGRSVATPPPPPTLNLDDEAAMNAARQSALRTKRRAAGGASPRSTLLTGPSGLADVPMQRKTLLGS